MGVSLAMNLTGMKPYQKASAEDRKRDKAYLAWLRNQPCMLQGTQYVCAGDVVAAHVRLGGRGGLAFKPLLSALPMCDYHHRCQHNSGHTVFGNDDWWLERADLYLSHWEKELLNPSSEPLSSPS